MNRTATSLLCTFIFSCPLSTAFAHEHDLQKKLRGTYHLTAVESCVEATDGFGGSPLFTPMSATNDYISYVSGSITFDRVGNAVSEVNGMTVLPAPNSSPIRTGSFTCNFAYVVKPDRSFTLDGYCTGNLVVGFPAPLTIMITGIKKQGVMGSSKKMLLVSMTEPNVQEVYVGGALVTHRLCSDTETYMEAKKIK